ncbi:unnamed protein product [Caenorhabditis angaria]|uniref:Globin domain-containing protein n=1 Tax=Caenorhabditis angaria TaxID=860376 RepID=A0A9P1I6D7_9PELO|nr:unnamed protein product [Caenorhabditis angaria]
MGSKNSVPDKKSVKIKDFQILNAYQKSIIRQAWKHMSVKGPSNCGSTITRRMMARKCTIGDVLDRNSIDYHNLEISCKTSTTLQKIAEICKKIGQQHAKYRKLKGMKIDYWDKLGEAITETIREYQGWKIHRESLRAATILTSYVVDQLRFGYSRGLHANGSREEIEEKVDQNP